MRLPNLLILVVALGLLTMSGVQLWRTAAFAARAQRGEGVVVDDAPHPRIRMIGTAGAPVEFTQNGFVPRQPGARVPVLFEAHDPAGTARVATFRALWLPSLWSLVPGLGFVLLLLAGARFGVR